jgi:hypothetical protein
LLKRTKDETKKKHTYTYIPSSSTIENKNYIAQLKGQQQ